MTEKTEKLLIFCGNIFLILIIIAVVIFIRNSKTVFKPQAQIVTNKKNYIINSDFSQTANNNLPFNWQIQKGQNNTKPDQIKTIASAIGGLPKKQLLYISTSDRLSGLYQSLPKKIAYPIKLTSRIYVVKGTVRLSLTDIKGREIYAGETSSDKKWQDISTIIRSNMISIDDGKITLDKVIIQSEDKESAWYVDNIQLSSYQVKRPAQSATGTYKTTGVGLDTTGAYHPRVMLIALNPVENNENLAEYFRLTGGRSALTTENEFTNININDFREFTHNRIQYENVPNAKLTITSFPPYTNGFAYDFSKYRKCLSGDPGKVCEDQKWKFDHIKWVKDNRICEIAEQNNIDDVWLIGSPYLTTWETFLIGPDRGFDNNEPFYKINACQKRHIVRIGMYGSIGSGHLAHMTGHVIERIMEYYVGDHWSETDYNRYWEDFSFFQIVYHDLPTEILPQTFCGNIHWPSNGRRHYDASNIVYKDFSCIDWRNFPNLKGEVEDTNCTKWGCTNIGWEKYWLSTLPDYWWSFLVTPEETVRYVNSGAPIPPNVNSGEVCGRVIDANGQPLSNINIGVINNNFGYSEVVKTDVSGYYKTTKTFEQDIDYAVRPTPPSGYTAATTTTASVWDYCRSTGFYPQNPYPTGVLWGDTPINSSSYECQKFKRYDCANEDSSPGNICRCNFQIRTNTILTPTPTPTPTQFPLPTKQPTPICTTSSFKSTCNYNSNNWCSLNTQNCNTGLIDIPLTPVICQGNKTFTNNGTYCQTWDNKKSFTGSVSGCTIDNTCPTPTPYNKTFHIIGNTQCMNGKTPTTSGRTRLMYTIWPYGPLPLSEYPLYDGAFRINPTVNHTLDTTLSHWFSNLYIGMEIDECANPPTCDIKKTLKSLTKPTGVSEGPAFQSRRNYVNFKKEDLPQGNVNITFEAPEEWCQ